MINMGPLTCVNYHLETVVHLTHDAQSRIIEYDNDVYVLSFFVDFRRGIWLGLN